MPILDLRQAISLCHHAVQDSLALRPRHQLLKEIVAIVVQLKRLNLQIGGHSGDAVSEQLNGVPSGLVDRTVGGLVGPRHFRPVSPGEADGRRTGVHLQDLPRKALREDRFENIVGGVIRFLRGVVVGVFSKKHVVRTHKRHLHGRERTLLGVCVCGEGVN